MDAESVIRIRQIVTEATQTVHQEIAMTATTLRDGLADIKRHTGILVEDLHRKLDVVMSLGGGGTVPPPPRQRSSRGARSTAQRDS